MWLIAIMHLGSARADNYWYSWGAWDGGLQPRGGSGTTKYYSYEESLQAIRALWNRGWPEWRRVEPSSDPQYVVNPFLPKEGYLGLGVTSPMPSVSEVCILATTSYCGFTGNMMRWLAPYDYWSCEFSKDCGWWGPVVPDCSDYIGYGWIDPPGQTDFVATGRVYPQGMCGNKAFGQITPHNFESGKCDDNCESSNPSGPSGDNRAHPSIGNPINAALGIKVHREPVYAAASTPQPLRFEWLYSSNMYQTLVKTGGWSHTYSRLIAPSPNMASVTPIFAYRESGFVAKFSLTSGVYTPAADTSSRLTRLVDGSGNTTGWTYYVASTEDTETYDSAGKLISIQSRSGATTILAYSDASTPPSIAAVPGLLMRVTDAIGRQLNFTYNGWNLLATLTDPSGRVYTFGYDVNDNLVSITWPDAAVRQFLYENATYASALTGIIDENGQRYSTYTYDTHGRAIAESLAGGADSYSFVYNTDGTSTITDPKGMTRTFTFTTVLGAVKNAGISQPCMTCGVNSSFVTYDANGNVSSRTDFNNKKICYSYDLTRNLETARLEGALSTESCSTVLATPPNRPDVRKATTTWNAKWRLPATMTEPAPGGTKKTTFTYDASGNLTQKSITAPKNDGSGTNITRARGWTYGTLGRVATATDPDNNVTTYGYYGDTDPKLGQSGNLQTVTNAAGHVTTINAYDLHGRTLTATDPNGLVTTLAYDTRGRLTSRQVGVETTTYTYDGVGQLTRVTTPDGSYVQYSYDTAHRLTQINDGLGNKIVYTLDNAGNRTAESAYDPGNVLARTRSSAYSMLNQLYQSLGAVNQTTTYAYDGNYNRTSVTDPLAHQTANTFDALNRLIQVVDPAAGVSKYAYDGANNLTQVTDANANVTSYTYSGLNDVITLASPDTDTATSTYDAAGNILTKTDARGATATYTYDTLNRATEIVYSKAGSPNETHSFAYDLGGNAKGRLSRVTGPAETTSWTYNSQGRVASKTQQVGSVARTLSYGYNAAGQLTTMTTPSGQVITYGYLNNRISTVRINGQPLITSTATEPFGPLAAWFWGNGLKMYRDFDNDGRLVTWEFRNGSSILRRDLRFDLVNRIVGIADPSNPAANQTYQYDALDRLTVAQRGNPATHTQQFTYDAVGNRLNATLDGKSSNLFYNGSNRLQAMIGVVTTGYLNGASSLAWTYNNANRLTQIQSNGTTIASYAVSALGQRVSKTVSGVTTLFVYDEHGRLVGEYDGPGNLIEETVWVEDLPVATLRPSGAPGNPTPISVYYVHADHLGAPRAVTRPSDNALMWQWDNLDPFGANAASENPAAQGPFKYNLRFPSQYYDQETGTHYNYFRDYDATIGRYEQSDLIGLRGGFNTYVYVSASPLRWSDQYGLEGGGFSTRYGNWCGRNWSGGQEGPRIPKSPAGPIDSVDECCMEHDYCWAKYEYDCNPCGTSGENKAGKEKCNQDFVRCTKNLEGMPPQNWPKPPRPGTGVDAYFFCQKAQRWFQ